MHVSLPLLVTALAASASCSIPCLTPCPPDQFCDTAGEKGCMTALYASGSDNCTTSSYDVGSWTSSAATTLPATANATLPITTASASGNVSLSSILNPTTTTSAITNNSTTIESSLIATNTPSPSSNHSYTTSGPTTTSVVAPTKTGGANAMATAVGMFALYAQVIVGVLWHF